MSSGYKTFNNILNSYSIRERNTLKKILVQHDLLGILLNTHILISVDRKNISTQFNLSSLVSSLLIFIITKLNSIKDKEQKSKVEFYVISLAEKILHEYLRSSKESQQIIIAQICVAIKKTCKQCNFDFAPYSNLFNHKIQSLLLVNISNVTTSCQSINHNNRCHSIHWAENGKLFELIDLLKLKGYIVNKKEVFVFFQSFKIGIKVHWNDGKKYHLAYLLYRLFSENYVIISGNKGYFSCAEKVFCGLDGKPFKNNSLRKISSKINQDKVRYKPVIQAIDDIMKKISKGTNGLLHDY